EHISIIPDYRQTWKVKHKLSDILLLTIYAVVSGAAGWDDIEDFGETHPDFATGEYQPRTGQVCGTPAENAPERRVYSGCDNREAPRALSHVLS
ncbi:transposase family protein, partial [Escherichia coli]|uniref:transposase family protein n=1 Tax=Escherichia coli TaxID=562 RepID=UPI003D34C620